MREPASGSEDVGIAILAGGEASRLPGKLTLSAPDVPMIVRVYRNVSPGRPTWIACREPFAPDVDSLLDCAKVFDRQGARGPLAGLLSAMEQMPTRRVFAAAGDAPFLDAGFIDRLAAAWQPGDEAVVPMHGDARKRRFEPLAALYDRRAFLREGERAMSDGGSLHAVLERLRVRPYPISARDTRIFTNVNTPEDYAAAFELDESP